MQQTSREVSYPSGVRALLMPEASRRRAIESSILSRLEERGSQEIILPIVDYVDVYATSGSRSQRGTYRFTDRAGDLLAIRSDFTPMVARALAPALDQFSLPLEVHYRGDVVRTEPARLGRSRESFQIGAERIGDSSTRADLETILLACACLTGSLDDAKLSVTLSDASLLPLLLEACDLTAAQREEVRYACAGRRRIELEGVRDGETGAWSLIQALAAGRLSLDELQISPLTQAIAARMTTIIEGLSSNADVEVILALDDPGSEYYTDVFFRIFMRGSHDVLASGGRYDQLYGLFGTDAPAIGFTINVDAIEETR